MHRRPSGLLLPNPVNGFEAAEVVLRDGRPVRNAKLVRKSSVVDGRWLVEEQTVLPPMKGGDRAYVRALQEPQGSQLVADATAITGTAEALMWPAVLTAIGANSLRVGQQFFITAGGVTTTPASAATTMTVNPRYGTTTGGTSLGISNTSGTALASQTNVPWDLFFQGTVRSIGTGASLMAIVGTGAFRSVAVGTAALAGTLEMGGTVLTTADSTTAQGIVFGAILGGSASWTLTTRYVQFELDA